MSKQQIDYASKDPIERLRAIHENLLEHELTGTAGNVQRIIDDLATEARESRETIHELQHDLCAYAGVPMPSERERFDAVKAKAFEQAAQAARDAAGRYLSGDSFVLSGPGGLAAYMIASILAVKQAAAVAADPT